MARYEVITGVERHRRWTDDEKLAILREAFSPGAVVVAVARRHDIRFQQIYSWRKKFAAVKPAPVFLPVSVVEPGSLCAQVPLDKLSETMLSVIVEISLRNGRSLKIPADLDRACLTSLIACAEAS